MGFTSGARRVEGDLRWALPILEEWLEENSHNFTIPGSDWGLDLLSALQVVTYRPEYDFPERDDVNPVLSDFRNWYEQGEVDLYTYLNWFENIDLEEFPTGERGEGGVIPFFPPAMPTEAQVVHALRVLKLLRTLENV